MSSRSLRDEEKTKMKEEARKERFMTARSAKLPHVPRNEIRAGDLGFVSRKVPPDADDNLSVLLKNGLIDYRELLGTLGTREDYRYLGIDNVPGTPEVNIAHLDESFRFPKHVSRVNGFKPLADNSQSKVSVKRERHIKQEPLSPKNAALKDQTHGAPRNSQETSNVGTVKEEPLSPKNRVNNTPLDATATQSIGEAAANRSKTSHPRTKPPVLKMPVASKFTANPANTNDKSQKAHPSKIESILEEMTEVLPPLTDIRTPVKSQDTRFPFPHLTVPRDFANQTAASGEQNNHGKTDEILKNDLITTSDDESDDDNERSHVSKTDPVLGATKRRLSASSSSSSDGSSSESSSDSESSDSENDRSEQNRSSGRKGGKRPSNMPIPLAHGSLNQTPLTHGFLNQTPLAHGSLNQTPLTHGSLNQTPLTHGSLNQTPLTHGSLNETPLTQPSLTQTPLAQTSRPQYARSDCRTVVNRNILKDEELEKQVSPLNSMAKEARKEAVEVSPVPIELPTRPSLNDSGAESPIRTVIHNMGKNLNSTTISSSKMSDSIPNGLRTDMQVDQELTNGVYESFPYDLYDSLMFGKPEDLMPPNFDSESLADIIDMRSPNRFDPLNLPIEEHGGLSAPSTVNLDSLKLTPPAGFDTDNSFHNEKTKGGKQIARLPKSATESEDNEGLSNVGGRNNNASTPIQTKMQSKKDKEQEWFMKILSPNKKTFDVPYVNPEKLWIGGGKELQNTAKASNNAPLKVQIPLAKLHHPGKKAPRLDNSSSHPPRNRKPSEKDGSKSKSISSKAGKSEKPRQSGGKDIEQIKSLMRELSNKASEDEEVVDVISTPSPLKPAPKLEARVSGKNIRGTPVSYVAKKEPPASGPSSSETAELTAVKERTKESSKKKGVSQKGLSKKRTSSSLSHGDSEQEPTRIKTKKHKGDKMSKKEVRVSRPVIDHNEDSSTGFRTPNSVGSNYRTVNDKLLVSINLSQLRRLPGNSEEEEDLTTEKSGMIEDDIKGDSVAEMNSVAGPLWKPPPNIKIPKITKPPEDDVNQKGSKICSDSNHDCIDTDTSSNCSSTCKPSKETTKSRKNRPLMEGRGVKRKEWDRTSKNANPNVCGMCGSLQKDSGRDPIRLGAYKTSYGEYLNLGKRCKHRADCLEASERAPKYIDAVLKYIQYLVGLEITGKTGTKLGFEEYMCITSQCIDLVDFVVNQYGKKENNNISNYDSRFVYLCLRLQSVLYFKLFGAKKDSAARYSKLLSEYFKLHRSPHRVNIKGSTGTPSPMSPTSSHTGSVASFGSSVSNGSYEKMLNVGSVVSIPTETFERMQQYFTYTKYLLHGHRLWEDADSISNQCQEFINIVSRRVGSITIQSSMLHLVDYISTGLQVIKDSGN